MLRLGTIDHGLGEQLWCCKCEDLTQKYDATVHSAHNEVPDFLWYGRRPSAWEFRTFRCKIKARINTCLKNLDESGDNILNSREAKADTILYNSNIF